MKNTFIKLALMFLAAVFISGCQNKINTPFANVDKLTIEGIAPNGQKNLILEITDKNEIEKIIGFIEEKDAGIENCSFQLRITFQKFNNDNVQSFINLNGECNSISYTYQNNFYSKSISLEGANYLRLMTGI